MDRGGPAASEARAFAAALERGDVKVTTAWVPGDDEPEGNWMRWALTRYCFDPEGKVIPELVDAMDRWPMEKFEQIVGIGSERADLACAWQDFRHKRIQKEAATQAAVDAANAPRRR